MHRSASRRATSLTLSTALAAALLAGCTAGSAPRADVSAGKAEAALARGKAEKAIAHAEAAVAADPLNAAYRATLASAYLDAGRFASAATTFDDAMKLGDNSPRTALSLALALMGQGRMREAAALLNDWEDEIAPADLGLALALAGQPDRGIHILSNAIRSGQNDAKARQNLAYAYALAGRWREARVMASQDVPADKVGERMEQWAMSAHPDAWQRRVAGLIGVPAGAADAGQPVHLALVNTPSIEQLASEASALAAAEPGEELPPLALAPVQAAEPVPAEPALEVEAYPAPAAPLAAAFESAFGAAPAPVAQDAGRFVRTADSAPARAEGTHLVQLGSFSSEQGARRAWGIYVKRYPQLADHRMVISEAVVGGKRYWRVSAAGFGKSDSAAMCGRVKSRGQGCFAWAEGRPLPGAVDTGTRLAMR